MCYRGGYKRVVRAPQRQLASLTMLSPRTVQREITKLQELGVVEREGHGRYRLGLDSEDKGRKELEMAQAAREDMFEVNPDRQYSIRYDEHNGRMVPVVTDEET